MSNIILYHGSPDQIVTPTFGLGEDRHDYGRGFYLTENIDLADVDILEELLSLGDLGVQYCLKSGKAYEHLSEVEDGLHDLELDLAVEKVGRG